MQTGLKFGNVQPSLDVQRRFSKATSDQVKWGTCMDLLRDASTIGLFKGNAKGAAGVLFAASLPCSVLLVPTNHVGSLGPDATGAQRSWLIVSAVVGARTNHHPRKVRRQRGYPEQIYIFLLNVFVDGFPEYGSIAKKSLFPLCYSGRCFNVIVCDGLAG